MATTNFGGLIMFFVAEMKCGGIFEAESKKKLTMQMIEYYAQNKETAKIKTISCIFEDNHTIELPNNIVQKIQEIIEKGIAEYSELMDQERYSEKEIEHEFYANLL